MAAEPRPASLEKAARCTPVMRTPTMPPLTPSGEKAPSKIARMASGMAPRLPTSTMRQATT